MPRPLEVILYAGVEHVHESPSGDLLGWATVETLVCYHADATAYTVRTLRVNVGLKDDLIDPERWDAVTADCLMALAR